LTLHAALSPEANLSSIITVFYEKNKKTNLAKLPQHKYILNPICIHSRGGRFYQSIASLALYDIHFTWISTVY
jgi:hypothetical protein